MNSVAPCPSERRPAILRLLLKIPETNAPFHQLSVPLAKRHRITICTFFRVASEVPPEITLFEGDGTVRGFFAVLRRALRAGPYDIVHAHTPHVAVMLLMLCWFRQRIMRSTVFTVHNCYENHKSRNKLVLLPVFLLFRRVVCCGRAVYESFPWLYRRLAGRRMRFVVNGVPLARIEEARRGWDLPQRNGHFTVASVGRLVPIKNLPTTLRAFERLDVSDARLVVIGDGAERDGLVEQSRSAALDGRVEFTGLLSREEVYRRLMQSDVYLSTSYGEGLPVAALEAMACGCPVVLSDISSHREIADGVDFIPLVPVDDAGAVADELVRLRDEGRERREQLGAACKQLVEERFSLNSMHRGYETIYRELMNTPAGGRPDAG